jgi:hypothetical protein
MESQRDPHPGSKYPSPRGCGLQLPGGTTEIRSGRSSWEDGADTSVKFAWPDKNGRIARGGEVPYAMAVRWHSTCCDTTRPR